MSRYISLGAARGIFTIEKELAMSNVSDAPWKNRWGVDDSWLVLLRYLHPDKLIADRYSYKDKSDVIGGLIITQR